MAARMSQIGMSAVRASELGMRHSAANLQMMAGTVANKAHSIANIISRNTIRSQNKQTLKTFPTAEAEDEDSLSESEPEVPELESEGSQDKQHEKEKEEKEKEAKKRPLLFPWEVYAEDGGTKENLTVKQKILDLGIYRRTFVEPADGEEEYVFDYAMLKDVSRELLLSNPDLREKHETLVKSVPAAVVSEETFWRNFFLRCNDIRLAGGMSSYLPEMEPSLVSTGRLAKLRRGLFNKTLASANSIKSRRGFLVGGRSTLSEKNKTAPIDNEVSDLELDVDGEIEKELVKRRPSRAVELCVEPVPPSLNNAARSSRSSSTEKLESTYTSKEESSPGNISSSVFVIPGMQTIPLV
ncbi:hypothetical protein PsorP6_009900 [Peronosclerospora sorghi]|uniref:Uncharacterized protein n=1 Tax=Peronosclerospora sorghi TaxID=230839 RepID=A0ACC0VXJ3_9STRA|nr:hypothetical protein PsorP6_009900 [Peronosclerospora sorghi]